MGGMIKEGAEGRGSTQRMEAHVEERGQLRRGEEGERERGKRIERVRPRTNFAAGDEVEKDRVFDERSSEGWGR